MISKEIEAKIRRYNQLRSQADSLQSEIEKYLEDKYSIYTTGNSTDTYGMDGNCPMYEWGTEYFDIQQIKDIVAFKEDYNRRVGEDPENREVSEHFARLK